MGIQQIRSLEMSTEVLDIKGGPEWSDARGWNNPEYYETIQCADIDDRAELIARSSTGIITYLWPKSGL